MSTHSAGSELKGRIEALYDLAPTEQYLLDRLATVADIIETLEADIDERGELDAAGEPRKALTELRQQLIIASRLTAALRLPEGTPEAPLIPQRRGGPRGAYRPRVIDGGV